jgi:hypothetical protein
MLEVTISVAILGGCCRHGLWSSFRWTYPSTSGPGTVAPCRRREDSLEAFHDAIVSRISDSYCLVEYYRELRVSNCESECTSTYLSREVISALWRLDCFTDFSYISILSVVCIAMQARASNKDPFIDCATSYYL